MNRSYTLHNDTAERLYVAANMMAVLAELVDPDEANNLRAAAGTLAAQNPALGEVADGS